MSCISVTSVYLHILIFCVFLFGISLVVSHNMGGRGRDTSDMFTPLAGRGRGLYSLREDTGAIPKLLFPTIVSVDEVNPYPELVQPTCSTPSDGSPDVTQQLQELIGELSSQIGESIISHLLASPCVANPFPTSPSEFKMTELPSESPKVNFIVRSEIK